MRDVYTIFSYVGWAWTILFFLILGIALWYTRRSRRAARFPAAQFPVVEADEK